MLMQAQVELEEPQIYVILQQQEVEVEAVQDIIQ
jgi:hypothetical protein